MSILSPRLAGWYGFAGIPTHSISVRISQKCFTPSKLIYGHLDRDSISIHPICRYNGSASGNLEGPCSTFCPQKLGLGTRQIGPMLKGLRYLNVTIFSGRPSNFLCDKFATVKSDIVLCRYKKSRN